MKLFFVLCSEGCSWFKKLFFVLCFLFFVGVSIADKVEKGPALG